jgi:Spy/CpxP family protein refolding chaperone
MKKTAILIALTLGLPVLSVMGQDQGGPPPATPPAHAGTNSPGGRGGFHLLPPRAAEHLNLTADQQKQVADLEADVKAKLEKILTHDQMEQLKQMRPPMRQGGPRGGGPGGHGPGGAPSDGGPGADERPAGPPEQ